MNYLTESGGEKITFSPEFAAFKALREDRLSIVSVLSASFLMDPKYNPIIHVCFIVRLGKGFNPIKKQPQTVSKTLRYVGLYQDNMFRYNARNGLITDGILFRLGMFTINMCLDVDERSAPLASEIDLCISDIGKLMASFHDDFNTASDNHVLWRNLYSV